ncbi:MAG: hypothetical protein GY832_17710 [Chloroflexi bacterium]|nr:hypothetical protein [Chloroflexota bacterium]
MADCIAPEEIESWQLDAYTDGERDPAVIQHVRRCPVCARRVATPDPLDSQLSAALFRSICPPVDELMCYQWGLLSEAHTATLAKHLSNCPHCAAEAAQLALEPSKEGPLPQMSRPTPPLSKSLRVLIARLLPSGSALALAPVRAGEMNGTQVVQGRSTTVQCYEVDDVNWDIILNWTPGPGAAFTLQGQLFGPGPDEMTSIQARLKQTESVPATTLDQDGVFALSPIPPGEYTLCLCVSQVEVQIPNVKLA